MTTCSGYVEIKDGYKKHLKELLLGLAASSPFVSLI